MTMPILLAVYRISFREGGGSENFTRTDYLSENMFRIPGICDRFIWPTIVGGYMKGRKKRQIEKNYNVLQCIIVSLGARDSL